MTTLSNVREKREMPIPGKCSKVTPKKKPRQTLFLRVREYPPDLRRVPMVWLIRQEGGAQTCLMHGNMHKVDVEKLAVEIRVEKIEFEVAKI